MRADELVNGLYELSWQSGGTSLAAVGRDRSGRPWYAPTNWVGFKPASVPCQDWAAVASAKLIRSG